MTQVSQYYIVPKNLYENFYQEQNQVPERFSDIPKSARKNVLALDEWLKYNNIVLSDSVIAYAVRGRFRPVDWTDNLHHFLQAPPQLLSLRVYNEIKKLRLKKRKEQT